MTTKFVDFTTGQSIDVYSLRNVAFDIAQALPRVGGYEVFHLFESWIENPDIETPPKDFTVDGEDFWKEEKIALWKEVYDREIEKEEARKQERLRTETVTKEFLVSKLIEMAEYVKRRNRGAYSHNRSNSLSDARNRMVELKAVRDFVDTVLGQASMPVEQRSALSQLIREAEANI